MEWKRDWSQSPIESTLHPTLPSLKAARLEKNYVVSPLAVVPDPFAAKKEGEGQMREKEFSPTQKPCSQAEKLPWQAVGGVEVGFVAGIREEPWNLFFKPDICMYL